MVKMVRVMSKANQFAYPLAGRFAPGGDFFCFFHNRLKAVFPYTGHGQIRYSPEKTNQWLVNSP